jgi:hypothetical protein
MTRRLLLLNGFAAIMVVLNHAASYGLSAMFQWSQQRAGLAPSYDQIGSLPYYILFMIHELAEFAIPSFLFVSGFFVTFTLKGSRSELTWDTLIPRIKKLILPFLFWSAVVAALLQRIPPRIEQILIMYYYIPLIIQYFLLSPLLVRIARKQWKLLLIVTAVIQLGIAGLRAFQVLEIDWPGLDLLIRLTPIWFFPGRIFYFSIGVVAGLHLQPFTSWLSRAKWYLLFATVGFLGLGLLEYHWLTQLSGKPWIVPQFSGISRALFAVSFVLTFLAFNNISYPLSNRISGLGEKSLGIYFVNTPAIYVAGWFIYRQMPWILNAHFLYQVVLILFGLGIPLLLMALTMKSPARRVYHYVFG